MKTLRDTLTLKNVMSALALVIAIVSLSVVMHQTTVQSVNVKKIVADFSNELAKSKVSAAKKTVMAKQFSERLGKTIDSYAASHHVLLVTHRAVVAGNTDATVAIEKKLNDSYRSQ